MEYAEIVKFLPPSDAIHDVLMVGCGNSRLPEQLVKHHGFRHVCCIDLSKAVIEGLRKHYADNGDADLGARLEWRCVDATKMGSSFRGRRFDLIIEKGTLDALMCSGTSDAGVAMLKEIPKLLQPDTGRFLLISHNPNRDSLLFDHGVALRVREVRLGELSPKAMLINALRSKFGKEPLSGLGKSTAMVEAMKEVRAEEARKRLRQFLSVLRSTKQGPRGDDGLGLVKLVDDRLLWNKSLADSSSSTPKSARQNHCWVYVMSAPASDAL
ncbi:hypothetical protein FOL46_001677 [Perkinsus olseni]|nr:hypothetical protein FOL46_001677 [Perkinsus olseni]